MCIAGVVSRVEGIAALVKYAKATRLQRLAETDWKTIWLLQQYRSIIE